MEGKGVDGSKKLTPPVTPRKVEVEAKGQKKLPVSPKGVKGNTTDPLKFEATALQKELREFVDDFPNLVEEFQRSPRSPGEMRAAFDKYDRAVALLEPKNAISKKGLQTLRNELLPEKDPVVSAQEWLAEQRVSANLMERLRSVLGGKRPTQELLLYIEQELVPEYPVLEGLPTALEEVLESYKEHLGPNPDPSVAGRLAADINAALVGEIILPLAAGTAEVDDLSPRFPPLPQKLEETPKEAVARFHKSITQLAHGRLKESDIEALFADYEKVRKDDPDAFSSERLAQLKERALDQTSLSAPTTFFGKVVKTPKSKQLWQSYNLEVILDPSRKLVEKKAPPPRKVERQTRPRPGRRQETDWVGTAVKVTVGIAFAAVVGGLIWLVSGEE